VVDPPTPIPPPLPPIFVYGVPETVVLTGMSVFGLKGPLDHVLFSLDLAPFLRSATRIGLLYCFGLAG